eukprot:3939698-Pleurochrysis_carterae.AAC.1
MRANWSYNICCSIRTTKNARKAQKRKGEQEVQRTVSVEKGQEQPNGKGTDGVGRREPDSRRVLKIDLCSASGLAG